MSDLIDVIRTTIREDFIPWYTEALRYGCSRGSSGFQECFYLINHGYGQDCERMSSHPRALFPTKKWLESHFRKEEPRFYPERNYLDIQGSPLNLLRQLNGNKILTSEVLLIAYLTKRLHADKTPRTPPQQSYDEQREHIHQKYEDLTKRELLRVSLHEALHDLVESGQLTHDEAYPVSLIGQPDDSRDHFVMAHVPFLLQSFEHPSFPAFLHAVVRNAYERFDSPEEEWETFEEYCNYFEHVYTLRASNPGLTDELFTREDDQKCLADWLSLQIDRTPIWELALRSKKRIDFRCAKNQPSLLTQLCTDAAKDLNLPVMVYGIPVEVV